MSDGFQVDTGALERVGRGYAGMAAQLREVLGGLDAQVGAVGDAMDLGRATAAYDQMWTAWRQALDGLAAELDGHASRLLAAIASYDMADNYAYFTDVADSVELAGP
jgi:WXG100 family type VII secretion target